MRKYWFKVPQKVRIILAFPLIAILLAMFIIEMQCRIVRGLWYMMIDMWSGDGKFGNWDKYMYRRWRK